MLWLARTLRQALVMARGEDGYILAEPPFPAASRFAEDDTVFPTTFKQINTNVANTKSAWVTFVASTPFAVGGLVIEFQTDTNGSYLYDIGVGAGPTVVFPNLFIHPIGTTTHANAIIFIPIFIRKGASISLRGQSPVTDAFNRAKVQMIAASALSVRPPRRWIDWATVLTSTQGGTQVQNNNGNNAKGNWVQLVGSTDFTTRLVLITFAVGTVDNTAVDFAVAAGGNEANGIRLADIFCTNETPGYGTAGVMVPWRIPGGSRVAARVGSATNGSSTYIQLHGGA